MTLIKHLVVAALLALPGHAATVKLSVDTTQTPDLTEWGQQALKLCAEWYPKIIALLPSDGFQPAAEVRLKFIKDMKGVAHAVGNEISISADYVRGHRDDFGMVVHELTHVVQAYQVDVPQGFDKPGWLVEGIADYVRIVHYEPQVPRPKLNLDKASYRDAYKTTAMFLEWIEKTHDKELVKKLNRSLRANAFKLADFQELTGKTVDELWKAYIESLRAAT